MSVTEPRNNAEKIRKPPEAYGPQGTGIGEALAAKQATRSTGPVDLKRTPPADMLAMSEPIAAAFNAWHEAQRNAQEVVGAYNAMTRGRAAAEAADARALADATTAGEKDPGAKNVQAYERKLSEAKRRADAAKLIERDRPAT